MTQHHLEGHLFRQIISISISVVVLLIVGKLDRFFDVV
jgi:hypothetical protein